MKLNEKQKEDAGFVRDIEAALAIKFTNDKEQRFRDALCKLVIVKVKELDLAHIRRIHVALCDVERPSDAELAARGMLQARIATHYNLRELRGMELPAVQRPAQKGGAK